MNTIVFGATGGTGAAVIRHLLEAGGTVTGFARKPATLAGRPGLTRVAGDAMIPADATAAMPGHEQVVISLGNAQNPFALRLGARRTTPRTICETGTANILAAMRHHAIRRVVCVTAFGIGATRAQAPLTFRIFYSLILREHMADKERQETLIRSADLDWTLIQPVGLTDRPATGTYLASSSGALRRRTISRADLAACIVATLADPTTFGQSLAVSG